MIRYLGIAQLLGDFKCFLVKYVIGSDFIIDVYLQKSITSVKNAKTKEKQVLLHQTILERELIIKSRSSYCTVDQCQTISFNLIVSHAEDKNESSDEETGLLCPILEIFYSDEESAREINV